MKYIVDTSVWSLALRRTVVTSSPEVEKFRILLQEGERVYLLGIILQEVLQGIKNASQFQHIEKALSAFPLLETSRDEHVCAAELYNICSSKGIQASTVDCFIAAVAVKNDCFLLAADRDFQHIAKYADLKLV